MADEKRQRIKTKQEVEQKRMEITNEVEPKVKNLRRKPRSIGGVVTSRDRLACRWVCEQGAMTVDQLWRAVWWSETSNSPRYAYDRVAFLTRAGFLSGIRTAYNLKTYFKATRAAHELAGTAGEGVSLIPLHAPAIGEIGHADGLTELRLAVQRFQGEASWRSDRVLVMDPAFARERFYSHVPDAIWTTPRGARIAVEYERTRKTISRLRLKVETFSREMVRSDRAFDRVLWVGVPGTMAALTQALASHPGQTLRTMDQFISELRGSSPAAAAIQVEG
ncbi:hypothetical protein HY464_02790 [Candidatus Peregrinibacteria bacterium]|nr:hypothetical protein [Candidatus Peregrinibacteria bacterium]